jgi:deoxyribonuclease-4
LIAEYPIVVNFSPPLSSNTNDVTVGPQAPRLLGIAEGVQWAVARGANACQLFLSGRFDWNFARWPSEEPSMLDQVIANTGFSQDAIFVHSNLYQNLCSVKPYHRERSRESLEREMEICDHFGLRYLIVHPGSPGSKNLTDWAITQIADAINCALSRIPTVTILLENMAGQGNIIGSDLAQLAAIVALITNKERIGYCIDTCHLHSSYLDLSKPNGADAFFTIVNDYLGIENVKVIHMNDSRHPALAAKDLHANLGAGTIGLSFFTNLVKHPWTSSIPLILETVSTEDRIAEQIFQKEVAFVKSIDRTETPLYPMSLSTVVHASRRDAQDAPTNQVTAIIANEQRRALVDALLAKRTDDIDTSVKHSKSAASHKFNVAIMTPTTAMHSESAPQQSSSSYMPPRDYQGSTHSIKTLARETSMVRSRCYRSCPSPPLFESQLMEDASNKRMDVDSCPHAPATTPFITNIEEYPQGVVGDAAYLHDVLHHREDLMRSSNTLRLKSALQKVYAEWLRQEAHCELLRFKLSVMVDMVMTPSSHFLTTPTDVEKAITRHHFLGLIRQAGNLADDFSFNGMTKAQAYTFFDKELGITPLEPHDTNTMEVEEQVYQFDPSLDAPPPRHVQPSLPKESKHVNDLFPPNKYYTPRWLVQLLRRFWADRGGIHLDPASSDEAQDVLQAQRYFTAMTEPPSRQQDWDARTLYLNPPFGNGQLSIWVRKFLDTMDSKSVHPD